MQVGLEVTEANLRRFCCGADIRQVYVEQFDLISSALSKSSAWDKVVCSKANLLWARRAVQELEDVTIARE